LAKIVLEGHIVVPCAELSAVRQALTTHIRLTREEPGCLLFQVSERPDADGVFDVYEEFVDRTAFEHHQARVRSSDWGALTVNVERHYQVHEAGSE